MPVVVAVEGSDGGRELAPGALAHPIVHPRPTLCARAKSVAGEPWLEWRLRRCRCSAAPYTYTDVNGWGTHTLERARTNLHTQRRVPPHVHTARSVSERVGSRDVGGLLKFL